MRILAFGAALLTAVAIVGVAHAEKKSDATGTWTWEVNVGGQTRQMTLKLKSDGDKLTGAMIGRNGQETQIEDGTIKDGEVSFTVTRERNGQKSTMKYSGKVIGDTIKGKVEFERDGQTQSRDWEAKRSKE